MKGKKRASAWPRRTIAAAHDVITTNATNATPRPRALVVVVGHGYHSASNPPARNAVVRVTIVALPSRRSLPVEC
jgi:hypothetical protein